MELLKLRHFFCGSVYVSIGETNTVVSAYTMYGHLQQTLIALTHRNVSDFTKTRLGL